MPSPRTRLERLNEILKTLKEKKGTMQFGKLFGEMALKYGVTRRTFWDYLDTLRLAGKIAYPAIHMIHKEGEIQIELLEN